MNNIRIPCPPTESPAPARTREQQAKELIGKIATFYARPGSVVRGIPIPGRTQHVGQIVAAEYSGNARGNLPDFRVTVRGRTGKTATVSSFDHYLCLHDTWQEALAYTTNEPAS
jgi:hypothetical protein